MAEETIVIKFQVDDKGMVKSIKQNTSTIKELERATTQLKTRRNNLDKNLKSNRKEFKLLENQIIKNQKVLTEYNNKIKNGGAGLKSFASGLKGMLTGLAVAKVTQLAVKAVKDIIGTFTKFGSEMSKVKALSNATSEEFELLRSNAILLGGSTSKSATEVSKLQQELAKKGLSPQEINKSAKAIVNLSIAAGGDLAKSATIAAATLRGYNKNASEMGDITDIMANAFTSTGLDLEKFGVGMANAQVAARTTGKSLEFTTASLGALVDTGVDASKAGTDLRKIFSELTIKGISLDEAYKLVENSSNKVATAQGLVGARAFSSLITLSEQKDKVEELTIAFENSAGSAEKMAKIMEDNLKGDTKKLSSSWERLILTMENGEGVLSEVFRGIIQSTTEFIDAITDAKQLLEDLSEVDFSLLEFAFRGDLRKAISGFNDELNDLLDTAQDFTRLELAETIAKLSLNIQQTEESTRKSVLQVELWGKAIEQLQLFDTNIQIGEFRDNMASLSDDAISEGPDAILTQLTFLQDKLIELEKTEPIGLDLFDENENSDLLNDLINSDGEIYSGPPIDEESWKKSKEAIKVVTDEIKRLKKLSNVDEENIIKIIGLIPKIKKEIKDLTKEQNESNDPAEILKIQEEINKKNEELASLTNIKKLKANGEFLEQLKAQNIENAWERFTIELEIERKKEIEKAKLFEDSKVLIDEINKKYDNIEKEALIESDNFKKELQAENIEDEREQALVFLEMEHNRQILELSNHKNFLELKKELDKKYAEDVSDINKEYNLKDFNDKVDNAQSALNMMSQISSTFRDLELAQAEGNAEKEAAINLKYAKIDKGVAAAQAGINTAVAVTKLLATPPLAIAAGIAGAAEIAAILATPISGGGGGGGSAGGGSRSISSTPLSNVNVTRTDGVNVSGADTRVNNNSVDALNNNDAVVRAIKSQQLVLSIPEVSRAQKQIKVVEEDATL